MSHFGRGVVNVTQPWIDASEGDAGGGFSVRTSQRVSKSARTGGKKFKNFKWDISADDLIVDTRAGPINAAFTGMLQSVLNEQFGQIVKTVSPATVRKRQAMARSPQSASYKRRYTGGRIGHTPPGSDSWNRWLRDSGRMQNTTIRLRNRSAMRGATGGRHSRGSATINMPANRLDPASPDWRGKFGQNQLQVVMREVPKLLPVLGRWDAKTIQRVNQGVDALLDGLVANSRKRFEALQRRKSRVLRQLLRAFGVNADFLAFTQQLRLQRGVRIGKIAEKRTEG